MPYTGVIEFDDFFSDLREAQKSRKKYWYDFEEYDDNWISDDYLEIEDNEIKIYDREFSKESGFIDCNDVNYFYTSSYPHYNDKRDKILYLFGAYYNVSREREVFCVELDFVDLIDLLNYFGGWTVEDNVKENYKKWFSKEIQNNQNNSKILALLYQELPEFVFEVLEFDGDGFKNQLLQIIQSQNKKGVLGILRAWLKKDPISLYELFDSDSITFGIYNTLYEEYGDRQELAEYVAILTQTFQIYKSQFGIAEKQIISFPQQAGKTYFESQPFIPKNAQAGTSIKPQFEIKKYNLVNPSGPGEYMTRVTKDKDYTQQFVISALGSLEMTFTIPKEEIKDLIDSDIFYVPIQGNHAIFSAEIPAILFHYLYETEYVNYINEGRLNFAINAATSIANIGIAKAIVNPANAWVYRFAVAEVVYESIHKAINNPIVVNQLQQTATGNHFLTIWNSYVALVGNTVFILHGFAEIIISLGKSKAVLKAFANDKRGEKALKELTDTATNTVDEALGLETNAKNMVKRLGLKLKTNQKTLDLVDKNGDIFFRFKKAEDVNKLLDFLSMSKSQRKHLINKGTEHIRIYNKNGIYKSYNASRKGFKIPLSNKGRIAPDFAKTPYLYGNDAIVKIKLTGDYDKDFIAAFKKMGITDKKVQDEILDSGYTWHHLDDLDENLESTFQLVTREAHETTYRHVGSADQIKKATGITDIYNSKK